MTTDVTYTRTDSGKAEAEAHFSMLRSDLKELLSVLATGDTFAQVWSRVPQHAESKLREALEELAALGYIKTSTMPAAAPEIDISRFLTRPVKEITIQQRRQAEQQTLASLPSLKQSGYFVSILSRPAERIPPRSGQKYSILIIDSDETNTLVAARTLLLAGFDTHVAVRRDEIVAELNRRPPPDAIAMDVMLPDVIGLELLARLREHPLFKTVPIIVMTTKAEHEDVVAALAYGASSYMTKPFKPEALLDSVEAVLGID
jgi:CheY-like chemotaxis protein